MDQSIIRISGWMHDQERIAEQVRELVHSRGLSCHSSFTDYHVAVFIYTPYAGGLIRVVIDKSGAYLCDLSVEAKYRRKGHGSALVQVAMDLLRAMGCKLVMLSVNPNSWTRGWYSRMGFTPFGIQEDGQLLMRRAL